MTLGAEIGFLRTPSLVTLCDNLNVPPDSRVEAPSASDVSSFGVSALSGGWDQMAQTGWLVSHRRLFLTALEGAHPRSAGQRGPGQVRGLLPVHPAPALCPPTLGGRGSEGHQPNHTGSALRT